MAVALRVSPGWEELLRGSNPAEWYATMPNGDFLVWFWNNLVADVFALTGGAIFDPKHACV